MLCCRAEEPANCFLLTFAKSGHSKESYKGLSKTLEVITLCYSWSTKGYSLNMLALPGLSGTICETHEILYYTCSVVDNVQKAKMQ